MIRFFIGMIVGGVVIGLISIYFFIPVIENITTEDPIQRLILGGALGIISTALGMAIGIFIFDRQNMP